MKRRRHKEVEIRKKLQEAERTLKMGGSIPDICRRIQISAATFHRWRKKHGRTVEQHPGAAQEIAEVLNRLKQLEHENNRLKILLAEQTLANAFLKDAMEGRTS